MIFREVSRTSKRFPELPGIYRTINYSNFHKLSELPICSQRFQNALRLTHNFKKVLRPSKNCQKNSKNIYRNIHKHPKHFQIALTSQNKKNRTRASIMFSHFQTESKATKKFKNFISKPRFFKQNFKIIEKFPESFPTCSHSFRKVLRTSKKYSDFSKSSQDGQQI